MLGYVWTAGPPGLDTGAGIPARVLKRIFEPFYTTKGMNGTGLGLWISREIIDRHQGVLRFRSSQKEGRRGTVVTMFLPSMQRDDKSRAGASVSGLIRPGYAIHLRGNAIEQGITIVSIHVQVEVGAAWPKDELRFDTKAIKG